MSDRELYHSYLQRTRKRESPLGSYWFLQHLASDPALLRSPRERDIMAAAYTKECGICRRWDCRGGHFRIR